MGQLITHACGHEQAHYLTGFASQQERKVGWLRTTSCRPCYIAGKKAEQAEAARQNDAAIVHLDLPALVGSQRQVGWTTTIRARRLATLVATPVTGEAVALQRCIVITDAKWWIDHRDLSDDDLAVKANQAASVVQRPDRNGQSDIRSQAA